jgi:hypothetical protein
VFCIVCQVCVQGLCSSISTISLCCSVLYEIDGSIAVSLVLCIVNRFNGGCCVRMCMRVMHCTGKKRCTVHVSASSSYVE